MNTLIYRLYYHSFRIHLPFFVDPILSSFPAARICCRIYRTPLRDTPASPCSSFCVTEGFPAIALWILSVLVSSVSAWPQHFNCSEPITLKKIILYLKALSTTILRHLLWININPPIQALKQSVNFIFHFSTETMFFTSDTFQEEFSQDY